LKKLYLIPFLLFLSIAVSAAVIEVPEAPAWMLIGGGQTGEEPPAGCETQAEACSDTTQGSNELSNDADSIYFATQFVASADETICKVAVLLTKNNSPTFNINAYIYDNNAGNPGSLVGSGSDAVAASGLPSSAGDLTTFSNMSGGPLTNTETYWLVLKASSQGDGTDSVSVHKTPICNGTGEELRDSADGSSWNELSTNRSVVWTGYKQ
jgi:hypothetical protein